MMIVKLLVYGIVGGLLAWPLLRGWQNLSRKMGWIPLVCIRPYRPLEKRTPSDSV